MRSMHVIAILSALTALAGPLAAQPEPGASVEQAGSLGVAVKTNADGEIVFTTGLVIEGKVEKPQVQFSLLKEAPPRREIRFEHSFLDRVLEWERENTFER